MHRVSGKKKHNLTIEVGYRKLKNRFERHNVSWNVEFTVGHFGGVMVLIQQKINVITIPLTSKPQAPSSWRTRGTWISLCGQINVFCPRANVITVQSMILSNMLVIIVSAVWDLRGTKTTRIIVWFSLGSHGCMHSLYCKVFSKGVLHSFISKKVLSKYGRSEMKSDRDVKHALWLQQQPNLFW